MPRNYDIIKKIDEGNQGAVFLAIDKRLKRKVAIKTLHQDNIKNETHRRRFKHDARILAKLNHPNIVTLFDYLEEDGFHLIMEYVNGHHLDYHVSKLTGPVLQSKVIDIGLKILTALEYIHEQSVLHRDIKPSNILIDQKENIKLLDFGIAKDQDADTNITTVHENPGGSIMWMSPEHINKNDFSVESDVYSLAVTLWYLITGKKPYKDKTEGEIYAAILTEKLPDIEEVHPNQGIDPRINEIIQKATKKNKEERYRSCGEFINDLLVVKKSLTNDPNTTEDDGTTDVKFPITVRIVDNLDKDLNNCIVKINDKYNYGSELTYLAIEGEIVKILILNDGYERYLNQFKAKAPETIKARLVKIPNDRTPFIILNFILSLVIMYMLFFL